MMNNQINQIEDFETEDCDTIIDIDDIDETTSKKNHSKHKSMFNDDDETQYPTIADRVERSAIKYAQKACRRGLTNDEKESGAFAAYDHYLSNQHMIKNAETGAETLYDACINAFLSALRISTDKYDRSQLVDDIAEAKKAAENGKKYSRKMFFEADIERTMSSLTKNDDDDMTKYDRSDDRSSVDAYYDFCERKTAESEMDQSLDQYRDIAQQHLIRLDRYAILSDDDQRKILIAADCGDNVIESSAATIQLLSCTDRTLRNMIADNRLQKVAEGGGRGSESLITASSVHAERCKIIDKKFGNKNKIDIADLSLIWRSANV